MTGTTADQSVGAYMVQMQRERKGTNFFGFSDANGLNYRVMDRTSLTVAHSGNPGYNIRGLEVKQSVQNYIIPCHNSMTATIQKIINYATDSLIITLTFSSVTNG